MVVTWTTFDPAESVVVFGPAQGAGFTRSARGNTTKFVDGGLYHRTLFFHSVILQDLKPGQRYGKEPVSERSPVGARFSVCVPRAMLLKTYKALLPNKSCGCAMATLVFAA